jgi:hypothetical protein
MKVPAAALLLTLAAAAPAARATAAPAYVSDPRIELLGVVQWLSGERPDLPVDAAYRDAAEKAFAPFRGHPVVSRWRDGARLRGKMDGRAIAILYFSDPPELAPKPGWAPPYMDDAEAASFSMFLAALRDFAKKSDFMRFQAAHRSDYERVSAAAASELGVADPLGAVRAYVGLELDARARWIVSPLFVPSGRNAYITPYPDPRTLPDPGKGRFEVATLLAYAPGATGQLGDVVTQRHRAALWQEPLFVYIDPALAAFDAARGTPARDFYGAAVAACRGNGADCAKNWLVAAISARLDAAAFGAPTNLPDGRDPTRDEFMTALAERLTEYEKDRKKWPTLWDFMPRLMSVFPEKAGLTPSEPALRRVRGVKELFPGAAAAGAPR